MSTPNLPTIRPGRRHSREIVAAAAATSIDSASCAGRGSTWTEAEAQWAASTTPAAAAAAAEPLMDVCMGCPAAKDCAIWAHLDEYTGIAGGWVFINGDARPLGWYPGRKSRKSTAA